MKGLITMAISTYQLEREAVKAQGNKRSTVNGTDVGLIPTQ